MNVKFTITARHINESLARQKLQPAYPGTMPFYLYSGPDGEFSIEHKLTMAPNAQLSAANVTLTGFKGLDKNKLYDLTLDKYSERLLQPLSIAQPPAFFTPGKKLNVTVRAAGESEQKGALTLPSKLVVDYDFLNQEISADIYITSRWHHSNEEEQQEIDEIAKNLVDFFAKGKITWTDNVVHALHNLVPLSQRYSVTLGVPVPLPQEGTYFAIVSRFVCQQSSNRRVQSLAMNQEWIAKLSGSN